MVPAPFRENALCPVCGSLERERLIFLYLTSKTDVLEKNNRLLHVAPEKNLADFLSASSLIDYVSTDRYDKTMVRTDVTDMGFKDAAFDEIICSHVLEHVADDFKAMSELHRILRPGGMAILQVPIAYSLEMTIEGKANDEPEKREELYGQKNHLRLYGKDYVGRLERAGFNPQAINPSQIIGDDSIEKYGLNPEEYLFVCFKKR